MSSALTFPNLRFTIPGRVLNLAAEGETAPSQRDQRARSAAGIEELQSRRKKECIFDMKYWCLHQSQLLQFQEEAFVRQLYHKIYAANSTNSTICLPVDTSLFGGYRGGYSVVKKEIS